jgi:hypothetical protein
MEIMPYETGVQANFLRGCSRHIRSYEAICPDHKKGGQTVTVFVYQPTRFSLICGFPRTMGEDLWFKYYTNRNSVNLRS